MGIHEKVVVVVRVVILVVINWSSSSSSISCSRSSRVVVVVVLVVVLIVVEVVVVIVVLVSVVVVVVVQGNSRKGFGSCHLSCLCAEGYIESVYSVTQQPRQQLPNPFREFPCTTTTNYLSLSSFLSANQGNIYFCVVPFSAQHWTNDMYCTPFIYHCGCPPAHFKL